MCEFGDGDGAEHYGFSMPKARKAHTCDDCGGTIRPGEKYVRAWWVNDGNFHAAKSCAPCNEASEDFGRHHDGAPFPGYVAEVIHECFVENIEAGGGWMRWGRHLVGMKRRRESAKAVSSG